MIKFSNVLTITLALIFSQTALSTGSDGGNSVPQTESNASTQNEEEMVCVVTEEAGQLICFAIDEESDD